MKGKFPMRVALSPRAMEIIHLMKVQRTDKCPLVFQYNGVGLHASSMLNVISNMDEREPNVWIDPKMRGRRVTVHGFRSTFTDWAAETTNYDFKVYDKALGHAESNQTGDGRVGQVLQRHQKLVKVLEASFRQLLLSNPSDRSKAERRLQAVLSASWVTLELPSKTSIRSPTLAQASTTSHSSTRSARRSAR
jgi:integrase